MKRVTTAVLLSFGVILGGCASKEPLSVSSLDENYNNPKAVIGQLNNLENNITDKWHKQQAPSDIIKGAEIAGGIGTAGVVAIGANKWITTGVASILPIAYMSGTVFDPIDKNSAVYNRTVSSVRCLKHNFYFYSADIEGLSAAKNIKPVQCKSVDGNVFNFDYLSAKRSVDNYFYGMQKTLNKIVYVANEQILSNTPSYADVKDNAIATAAAAMKQKSSEYLGDSSKSLNAVPSCKAQEEALKIYSQEIAKASGDMQQCLLFMDVNKSEK